MLPVGSKTPVSILQEYFISQGITPSFECIDARGQAHLPVFTYRVSAGEYFADGTGPSKQRAKHEAAQQLLDIIQSEIHKEPAHRSDQLKEVLKVISSPQERTVDINAVGVLSDYCFKTNNPEPVYLTIKEEGPPHQRVFTFQCNVSAISESGCGRTKKEAKHQAAYKMYLKLKGLYGDVLNEVATVSNSKLDEKKAQDQIRIEQLDKEMTEKYFNHKNRSRPVITATSCISHYRAYVLLLDTSPTLTQALHETEEMMKSPYDTLQKIARECDIKLTVTEIRHSSGALNSVFVEFRHVLPLIRNGLDANHASRIILEALLECVSL